MPRNETQSEEKTTATPEADNAERTRVAHILAFFLGNPVQMGNGGNNPGAPAPGLGN